MRRFSAGLILLIVLQPTTPTWAWGRLGHRVVANFAERHLSDDARAGIAELLEPGESLADASTWADEHRRELPGTATWHYANVPLDAPRYDDRFAGAGPEWGQIVPRIHECRSILADRSRPADERRHALRFLVHLVGDVHQPLHVGDGHDRGGNGLQVRFYWRGTNLHHVWDSLLLEQWSRDEDLWHVELAALDHPRVRALAIKGAVEDWATESLLSARQAYLDPATGWWIGPGALLGEAYTEVNLPLATRRLYQAGVRLAFVLNESLGPK